MARYERAAGVLTDWLGESPSEFVVQSLGGGTAPVLLSWIQPWFASIPGLTADWIQAISGAAIARAGTQWNDYMRDYGTGVLKELAMRLIKGYIHPGGSVVVQRPGTAQIPAAAPIHAPMGIRELAIAQSRMEVPR
jgi:hypothetical protein